MIIVLNKKIIGMNNIIPKHLENMGFVKVLANKKKAFEIGWPKNPYTYQEISKWVNAGNNYGLLAGYKSLLTIDIDRKTEKAVEITDEFISFLPETFTVLTPSGGLHYHYICEDWDSFYNLEWDSEHIGECRWSGGKGYQTIGPGSIHPDFNKPYIVKTDIALTNIEAKLLKAVLAPYIGKKENDLPKIKTTGDGININIQKFTDICKLKRIGNKYMGVHPVHGSTTGGNFSIDTNKNLWHCFRHGSGGEALSLIAVLENIIPCECAVPGGLKGRLYTETVEIAKSKYGVDIVKEVRVKRYLKLIGKT